MLLQVKEHEDGELTIVCGVARLIHDFDKSSHFIGMLRALLE